MIILRKIVDFLNKFKIPTLLGLGVIVLGTGVGVTLIVMGRQSYTTQASPDQNPQNIVISNVTDVSTTISWNTSSSIAGFITFGPGSPDEKTVLDVRDITKPQSHISHYITIKNLLPQQSYQFKIFSGKLLYPEVLKFTTSAPVNIQNKYQPIIGSVVTKDPTSEGLAYLAISGANVQSSLIKNSGNFIIPISQMQKEDLTGVYLPQENTLAKLTIITELGQSSVVFNLNDRSDLGALKIGENLDLTVKKTDAPKQLDQFDLNGDNIVNSSDYSIVLKNFGPLREASKNPKDKRADLNKDGIVDQKDLDLISKRINK